MDSDAEDSFPKTKQYFKKIETKEREFTIYLFVIEYSNAIQVAVYEGKPSLGSMSFGYVDGDLSQHQEIFTGNHNQYSNALALILAKRTSKVIYASVNLARESVVELTMIKNLLDNYLRELDK
ncbi:MAG: hypothetical protein GPJ54_21665 [Candidatus Heimdallarchaeota archaeon]|nr:hypothetical protein [Candidatus Heimdallarchaeota archaeon]